jgi:hypothetical protein
LESAPDELLQFDSEFGQYLMKIEKKKNGILIHRKLIIIPSQQPAGKYNALREFFKKVSKADSVRMVLGQKKT